MKRILIVLALAGFSQLATACRNTTEVTGGDKDEPLNPSLIVAGQTVTTDEDAAVEVTLTPEAVDLTAQIDFVVDQQPAHGTLTKTTAADGVTKIKYTPNADFNGDDSITVHAEAGAMQSEAAKVTIHVKPVNDPPLGKAISGSLAEDGTQTVDGLAQASDIDGDVLTATVVGAPSAGTVSTHPDGTFTYFPNADFNGNDSFTFSVSDGKLTAGPFTASLTVTPVNDAPVAFANAFTTAEDTLLTVAAAGVLGNDTDIDSAALTAVLVADVTHGTLALASDGSFTYTPVANYNGADSFTYKTNDGALDSGTVTVSLTVTAVNDAPVAVADSNATFEDTLLTVAAPGVLGNDSDIDSGAITAALVSDVSNGTLALALDGSYTYTPAANFNGADSFTYKVNDGSLDSITVTVSLTVTAVNDAPSFTKGGDLTVLEDAAGQSVLTWATAIASGPADEAAQSVTFAVTNNNASLFSVAPAVAANGTLSYTPAANASGAATITVSVWDNGGTANGGANGSAAQTATLTVTAVNDAPAFTKGGDQTVLEDAAGQSVLTWAMAIASGPADEAAQAVTFAVANDNPGLFSVAPAVAANGTLSYTPAANANGAATITVSVWDNGGTANGGANGSAAQTATLTVTAVNDAPVAYADSYTATEDTQLIVAASGVLGNDSDVDSSITAVVDANPAHGNLAAYGDGSFTYTPDANYNGADSFTYHVTDLSLNSGTVTVTLDITSVNDAPNAVAGMALFTNEQVPVSDVTSTTDADGDLLMYTVATAPTGGNVNVNALTGEFKYEPHRNFSGSDEFWIAVSDGALGILIPISVSVNSTDNDAPVAGVFGRAVNLTNTSQWDRRVDLGTVFSGRMVTAATVEAWYKLTSFGWGQEVDLFGLDGEMLLGVDIGGQLQYEIGNSNPGWSWVSTGVYMPLNEWAHVAMVYDYGTITLYVNGIAAYSLAGSGDIVDADPGYNKFYWGNRENPWSQSPQIGFIDEGRIWLAARTQQEIAANMDHEISGGQGLAGLWNFDETSGAALDQTFGGVNGTLVSASRAASDLYATLASADEDTVASGNMIGRDPDGDTLTFTVSSQPAHGVLTMTDVNTGAFTFTPDADWNGTTSFAYSVSDGVLASAKAIGFITINPTPDDWSAIATNDITDEDMPIYSGMNPEINVDQLPLNYTIVTAPTNGGVNIGLWGYDYYPNTDYFGSDSFVVAIDDGVRTEYGTVNLVVNSVNDLPVLDQPLDVATNDDTMVSGGPLTGSDPVEGSAVTFGVSQQPAGGAVTMSADTLTFYYTPNHGTSGVDTFYLVANDGTDDSAPRMVQVAITVVNDPPVLTGVTAAIVMNEEGTGIINVTGTDPDGDPLRGVVISHPTLGYVTVNGTQITYHAGTNRSGVETLHVTINDYYVNAPTWLPVSVTINALNDAPVPSAGAIGTSMGVTGTTRVTPHDPENDAVTYSISTPPANGVATVSASGWVSYTPNPGFTGDDAMFVQVSDGSLSGTVLVEAVVLPAVSSVPTLPQLCAGTIDTSVILMDSPLDGSSISNGTYTLTGQILYNATYDWGSSSLSSWNPSSYEPSLLNVDITTGCGAIPFAIPITYANTGSGYTTYLWFNYTNQDVMFQVDSLGSLTVDILAGTLSFNELITSGTVDELFVMTYDLNGDTADLNANAYIYGYNLYAERLAVSPDPVTMPVRFRETLGCNTNWYSVEIDAYGASSGGAYKYFEFPVHESAPSEPRDASSGEDRVIRE